MHRARSRSVSQLQDKEGPVVDSHLNYINDFLKWTTKHLDRFIKLLETRCAAEDAYVLALSKISKPSVVPEPEPMNFFGEHKPTFMVAMEKYEGSVSNVLKKHQDVRDAIRAQIDELTKVKQDQENMRKTIKRNLGDSNKTYTKHRMAIPKLYEDYSSRCGELRSAQQHFQLQEQQQQQQQQQQPPQAPAHEQDHHSEHTDISEEDVRPRSSNELHHASPNSTTDEHRKTMAGFMAQVRSQFSNMAVAAGATTVAMNVNDANKQFSKMKKFIEDADHKYREGVRELEISRRKQVHVSRKVIELVDHTILDQSLKVKGILKEILTGERAALVNQVEMADGCVREVERIRSETDKDMFNFQCSTKGFMFPPPVQYENYYYPGKCKDMLFGMSLKDYYLDHRDRPVPLLVKKCIEAIEHNGGLQKEGIYRISPTRTKVEILKNAFERDEEAVDITKHDVFTFAAVLKNYLRDLKEPLFDMSVDTRREYNDITDQDLCLQFIRDLIWKMTPPHRETLHTLICHLQRVNEESKVNKMGVKNLSVVFTPNIFQNFKSNTLSEWSVDNVFEDLFYHSNSLFVELPKSQPSLTNTSYPPSHGQTGPQGAQQPLLPPPPPHTFSQQTPPKPLQPSQPSPATYYPNPQQHLPPHLSSMTPPHHPSSSQTPYTPSTPQTPVPLHMPQYSSRDPSSGMLLTAGMAPPPMTTMELTRGLESEPQQQTSQLPPLPPQGQHQVYQPPSQPWPHEQEPVEPLEQAEPHGSEPPTAPPTMGATKLSRKPTVRAPPRQDSLSRKHQEKELQETDDPSQSTTQEPGSVAPPSDLPPNSSESLLLKTDNGEVKDTI